MRKERRTPPKSGEEIAERYLDWLPDWTKHLIGSAWGRSNREAAGWTIYYDETIKPGVKEIQRQTNETLQEAGRRLERWKSRGK